LHPENAEIIRDIFFLNPNFHNRAAINLNIKVLLITSRVADWSPEATTKYITAFVTKTNRKVNITAQIRPNKRPRSLLTERMTGNSATFSIIKAAISSTR
jgi:hypothetical protein